MREAYDNVVIGSGFGGAIPAFRLARAGQSVAVLERGRRFLPPEFPRTVGQVGDGFFRPGGPHGFLEYRAFKNIDVIQGVGVGGGSLHYFNVNLEAPERVLARWPKPLGRACLDAYYGLVLTELGSAPLTPPSGKTLPPRTRAFLDAAARGKGGGSLVNIAVHTGSARPHANGIQGEPCTYCGNCMLGCQVGAKNTLDLTYLARAEREHGAEVFPLHKVTGIRPAVEKGEGYWLDYEILDHAGQPSPERGRVYGRRVVVAAGTLGSNELLLRCRDEPGALPKLSAALGRGFSGNGDFLFAGALRTPAAIDPATGPSITAVVDRSTAEHDIHVEDLGFPDPMLWFLEGALPAGPGRLVEGLRGLGRYLSRSLGLGGSNSRFSDEVARLVRGGRTNHFLPFLGMGSDAADGQLRLSRGQLDVRWSHRKSHAMFRQMEVAMRELAEASGGEYVTSFLWRWPFRKLLTAHPLGGCAIAEDPTRGVVDHRGQVFGYPGLFVTDGASIPSALSVNPSLTIGAVAERASFWMLHGRERTATDPG